MKYDHTKKNVIDAVGLNEKEYKRVAKLLRDVIAEYNRTEEFTARSQLLENFEEAAKKDLAVLKFFILQFDEYITETYRERTLQDSGFVQVSLDDPKYKHLKKDILKKMGACGECEKEEICDASQESTCVIKH